MMNTSTPSGCRLRKENISGFPLRMLVLMVTLCFTLVSKAQLVVTAPSDVTIECDASTDPSNTGVPTDVGGCAPWINEIHYDDVGTDTLEFIEIAGPAGFDLTGWSLVLYNGATGLTYDTDALTGVIDNEGNGYGALVFYYGVNGIQNGAPDGMALVNGATVQEFISYEGTFTAGDGPANGMLSVSIGVSENGEPSGSSVQRVSGLTWTGPAAESPGSLNSSQTGMAFTGSAYTYSDVVSAGNCLDEEVITRTWTATDACGDQDTDVQLITIEDTTAPTISCPANVTINPGDATDPGSTGMPSNLSDNCDVMVGATFEDAFETNCPAAPDRIVRKWIASDNCGNVTTCIQSIWVTCQLQVTGACCHPDGSCTEGTALECEVSGGVYQGDGTVCGQVICPQPCEIVCPPDPPIIEWPFGFNLQPVGPNVPQDPSVDPQIYGFAEASGDCGMPFITYQDQLTMLGICPDSVWRLTRTWTLTEADGDVRQCVQTFYFSDTTDPNVECVAFTFNVEWGQPIPEFPPFVTDNCGTPDVTYSDSEFFTGQCPLALIITRTWYATDNCDNVSSCTQIINVTDTTPPSITCPDDVTLQDPDEPTGPEFTGFATATDNCGIPTVTYVDFPDFDNCPFETNKINRHWYATDVCGYVTTCIQFIWIPCCDPCPVTCPHDEDAECDGEGNIADITAWLDGFTSSEDCPGLEVSLVTEYVSGLIPPGSISYNDFSDLSDFTLNGRAGTVGNPVFYNGKDVLRLVDALPSQAGSAFLSNAVSLNADGSFSSYFTFQISNPGEGGADGLTFCMQPTSNTELGGIGGGMGYYLLSPSLVVEFDSWDNGGVDDNNGNHVGIALNGDYDAVTQAAVAPDFDNGDVWSAWVDYNGATDVLEVRLVVGDGAPRPVAPNLSYVIDVPALLGSTDVFVGFTSATGAAYADHDIRSWGFNGEYDPIYTCGVQVIARYIATDICGNVTTCTRTLDIVDTQGPEMECTKPAPSVCMDHVITSSELIAEGYAAAFDICDPEPVISVIDSAMVASGCSQTWTYTFTAVDACGNQGDTCAIIVQSYFDENPPEIFCSNPPHLGCNPSPTQIPTPQQILNAGYVYATDDCGTPTIGLIPPITNTSNGCTRYRTYKFRATDLCGHQSPICTVTLTWTVDTIPPVMDCPDDISLQCLTDPIPAPSSTAVVATDDCALDYVTWVSDMSDGLTCPRTITRTYTAADTCGNVSYCTQYIIIDDTTPPVIVCPPTLVLECNVSIDPLTPATAEDNCTEDPFVTYTDVVYSQDCGNNVFVDGYDQVISITVRTFYATDECDNTASCTQHIILRDDLPPSLTCPDNVTIECTDDKNDLQLTGVATAIDLCDPDAYATILIDQLVFADDCDSVWFRYWIATDSCGNGNSGTICTQTITKSDRTAPDITCPEDITIECGVELPGLIFYNGHGYVLSNGFGSWEDARAEALAMGGDLVAINDAAENAFLTATFGSAGWTWMGYNDIASEGIFGWSNGDASGYENWAVGEPNDCCGGEDRGVFNWFAGGDWNDCEEALCGSLRGIIEISIATDNCQEVSLTYVDSDPVGSCPMVVTRTYYADDLCGNVSSCIQYITIDDTTPPAITCPFDLIVECGDPIPDVCPEVTDNCTLNELVDETSGYIDPEDPVMAAGFYSTGCSEFTDCDKYYETHTVNITEGGYYTFTGVFNGGVLTFGDGMGGLFAGAFDPDNPCDNFVAGSDDDNPNSFLDPLIIACMIQPGTYTLVSTTWFCEDYDQTYSWTIERSDIAVSHVDSDTTGDCPQQIVRTFYAEDECGNVSSCTQTIYIYDTTPPEIVCPDDVTLECNVDPLPTDLATATDICNAVVDITYSDEVFPQECDNNVFVNGENQVLTIIIRTHFATDACGNVAICTQTIMIRDDTPPMVSCPADVTIECDEDPNNLELTGIPTVADLCDPDAYATILITLPLYESPCSTVLQRVWQATDQCGNGDSGGLCLQLITLLDTEAPQITCPENLTLQCGNELPVTTVQATDNCNEFTTTYSDHICSSSGFTGDYAFENWTETEPLNNGDVTTSDDAVTLTGPDDGCPGGNSTLFSIVVPTSGTLVFSWNYVSDDVSAIWDPFGYNLNGTFYQLTDDAGGTVQSGTAAVPVIAGQLFAFEQNSVDCIIGSGATTVIDFFGCTDDELQELGDTCLQVVIRTHYAEDICGNVSSCVQLIYFEDTTPPVISCPANVTIECGDDLPTTPATATDLCDDDLFMTYHDAMVGDQGGCQWTVLRTHSATDDCGNVAACVQVIVIIDTTPPTITCPDDITVECPFATGLIVNGGFETMDFTGWSQINIDDGGIAINDGTFIPPSGDGPYPPCDGSHGAVTFQGGPGIHTLYQDVTIPATALSVSLHWIDRIRNHAADFSDPNQEFRVEVWDPNDNSVLEELYSTEPGDPLLNDCIARWADLSGYAGQTIRIAFTEQDNQFFFEVHLDAIAVLIDDTGFPVATDICDPEVFITLINEEVSEGTCLYTITRTFSAVDDCGNSATCLQVITVEDTTPPVLTCPEDYTVTCEEQVCLTFDDLVVSPIGPLVDASTIVAGGVTIGVTAWSKGGVMEDPVFVDTETSGPDDDDLRTPNVLYGGIGINSNDPNGFETSNNEPRGVAIIVQTPGLIFPNDYTLSDSLVYNFSDPVFLTSLVVVDFELPQALSGAGAFMYDVDGALLSFVPFNGGEDNNVEEVYLLQAGVSKLVVYYGSVIPTSGGIAGLCFVYVPCDTENAIVYDLCNEVNVICNDETNVIDECLTEITQTYSAADVCDNFSASCTRTITLETDTEQPEIQCPADLTLDCNALLPAPDLNAVVATDNCSLEVTVTWVADLPISDADCESALRRIYRATDECGNSAMCAQFIYFIDETPPVIACPEDATIECGDELPTTLATATDDCNEFTVTYADSEPAGSCPMIITRTHYAADICGNVSSCTQYIYIEDTTPPSITCPFPIGVECGDPIPMICPNAVDVCSAREVVGTLSGSLDQGDPVMDGAFFRTGCVYPWAQGDRYYDTYSFTVTEVGMYVFSGTFGPEEGFTDDDDGMGGVFAGTFDPDNPCDNFVAGSDDDLPNSFWDPQIITCQLEPGEYTLVSTSYWGSNPAMDYSWIIEFSDVQLTSVDSAPEGECPMIVTRTHYAEDECGNVSSCTQYIYIFDTTPPNITCPDDVTLECNVDTIPTTPATATDICDDVVDVTYVDVEYPQECDNNVFVDGVDQVLTVIVRTHYATDNCGNVSTCTQHIVIRDDTPPMVTCPDNVTIECDQDPNNLELTGVPIVEDLCDPDAYATIVITFPLYTSPCSTVLQRVWIATDRCGNGDSGGLCAQTITILDTTPPEISCPNDAVIECGEELPVVVFFEGHAYLLTTESGTWEEAQVQALNLGGDLVAINDAAENAFLYANFGANLWMGYNDVDTEGSFEWSNGDPNGYENWAPGEPNDSAPGEDFGVMNWGGSSQWNDFSPERPDYPVGGLFGVVELNFGSDNCQEVSFTYEDSAPEGTCPMVVTRTYYASDGCDNISSCTQHIYIEDTIAPEISCPEDVTIECGDDLPDPSWTVSDICDDAPVVTYVDHLCNFHTVGFTGDFDLANWTETEPDFGGDVTVIGTSQVVLTGPDGGCPGDNSTVFSIVVPTGGELVFVWNYHSEDRDGPSYDPFGYNLNGVFFLLTDDYGAVSQGGVAVVSVNAGDVFGFEQTSTDCFLGEGATTVVDFYGCTGETGYSCDQVVLRTLIATDECGNSSACGQGIYIEDTTAPAITCPPDMTLECDVEVPYVPATAVDICDAEVDITYSDVVIPQECDRNVFVDGEFKVLNIIVRTHYATDDCGNTSSCTQHIVQRDDTPPQVVCPPNVTVECGDPTDPEFTGWPELTDNCDPNPQPVYVDLVNGECPVIITRVWSATDWCGNGLSSNVCLQIITIEDTTPPSITCPFDIQVECGDPIPMICPLATDICSASELIATVSGDLNSDDPVMDAAFFRYGGCVDDWICGDRPYDTYSFTVTVPGTYVFTGVFNGELNTDGMGGLFAGSFDANDPCLNFVAGSDDDNSGSLLDPQIITCDLAPGEYTLVSTSWCSTADMAYTWTIERSDVSLSFTDSAPEGECPMIVTRTHYAEDECGNISSCTQYIYIYDTTPPSITCPDNVTLECNVDPIPTTPATATDICDDDVDVTYTDVEYPQECDNGVFIEGVDQVLTIIVRTHYATDNCGNVSTCTQHIVIRDDTPPSVTCPDNVTIECDEDPNNLELTGVPIVADLCDPDAYATIVITFPLYTSPCSTVLQRVWLATDQCGNGTSGGLCAQLITILDTTPPEISCPAYVTIECGDELPTTLATATDNCNDYSVTYADSAPVGVCPMVVTRTHYATDECGNVSSCTQRITIEDTIAPEITCPDDVTIECGDELPDPTWIVSDICDDAPVVTYVDHLCNFHTVGFTGDFDFINWTATEVNGGDVSTSGNEQVTLVGPNGNSCIGLSTLFSIVVPADGELVFVWNYHTVDRDGPSFDPFGYNLNSVFFQLTDDDGSNSQGGVAVVSVNAGDVFAFEQSSTDCILGAGATTVVDFYGCTGETGYSCDQVVLRTLIATDECGNSSACGQGIYIEDTTAPAITCPPDMTLECDVEIPVTTATATDICDAEVAQTYTEEVIPQECDRYVYIDGEFKVLYIIVRTHYATDDCGNVSSCTQHIVVRDDTPPVVVCPPNITIECDESTSPDNTGWPEVTDNCDPNPQPIYVDLPPSGNSCLSTFIRVWTATDWCGNGMSSNVCIQFITIEDTTPPEISCPPDVTIECGDPLPMICPASSDNCSEGELVASLSGSLNDSDPTMEGAFFNNGCFYPWAQGERFYDTYSFSITETGIYVFTGIFGPEEGFTDEDDGMGGVFAGNFDPENPCDNFVAGSDDDRPNSYWDPQIITCLLAPGDYVLVSTSYWGSNPAMDYSWTIELSDIALSHVDSDTTGSCPALIVRTHYAEDECGNVSSCTQHIYLEDTTPPAIACPDDVTLECNVDPIPTTPATVTDVCDDDVDVTYVDVEYPQDCANGVIVEGVDQVKSVIVRTHYATDECGNVSSCTQHIVIRDDTPPSITCPDDVTIECDQDPNDLFLTGVPIVEDLCDPDAYATIIITFPVYTDPCSTVLQRVWLATDMCGNGNSGGLCTQYITILDTQAPEIVECPGDVTIECGDALPTSLALATDNCNEVTYTYSDHYCNVDVEGFTGEFAFENWTATEPENNGDVTTIGDDQVVLTGPDDGCPGGNSTLFSIVIPATGELIFRWDYATDDSDGSFFDPFGYNLNGVFHKLTQDDGAFTGEVIQSGVAVVPVVAGDVFAFEQNSTDCILGSGATTIVQFYGCAGENEETCAQLIVRTHYAADICGNVSTCEQLIFIDDTTAPSITCPDAVTIECGDPIPTTLATATDLCDDALDITYVDNPVVDQGQCAWLVLRTHYATDDCGNVSSCLQAIFIVDTTPPVISCPADATVECGDEVGGAGVATATDACDDDPFVTIIGEQLNEGSCVYTIVRTYQATDECGNVSTCTQVITIEDTTPPEVICPPDETFSCDELTCLTFEEYEVNGQTGPLVVIDQVIQGGVTIDISAWSKGGVPRDAVLFNTADPHPDDLDLGTPNTLYGGPGINGDDPDGFEPTNNRPLGNILIVQSPGFAYPNDYFLSDSIVMEFSDPVYMESVVVMDFEAEQLMTGAGIYLYDAAGVQISFHPLLGDGNDNSQEVINLKKAGVSKLKLYYGTAIPSSGGLSGLCYVYVPCETEGVLTVDACSQAQVFCADTTIVVDDCTTEIVRTYTAEDACGNVNETGCTQTLTLNTDNLQPDIICPSDITIGCEDEVPAPDPAGVSATDNCSAEENITIAWVEDISEGLGCAEVIRRIYSATDECGNTALCVQYITREGIPEQIVFLGQVFLQAAMMPDTTMDAKLNDMGYLPQDQPYSMEPYNYWGAEHCDELHPDIVDWVLVQLRDVVTMEVVAQKAALVKESGMIVAEDCVSPVTFTATGGWYYVTICHRNHLGIATDIPMDCSEGWVICDFTEEHGPMEGMVEVVDGVFAMTRGDVNGDNLVKYNGSNNDKNAVLSAVGILTPNNVVPGYNRYDVNMDGVVKYNGSNNDKNAILSVVGLLTPNNIVLGALYE